MVLVRYFAGARAAAGVDAEPVDLAPEGTVDDVLETIVARHGDPLQRVLRSASFLLDEVAVRDRSARPSANATLDVLPPFAGG